MEDKGRLERHVLTQQDSLTKVCREVSDADEAWHELEVVVEALEEPSIYLVQAARDELDDRVALDLVYALIVFVQVVFPWVVLMNYATRTRPSLLAPGFHNKRDETPRRIFWLNNMFIDASASVFFIYLAWKTYSSLKFDLFRIFLAGHKSPRALQFGLFSNVVTSWSVLCMTYILFRLDPTPFGILMNSVALEFLLNFDVDAVNALLRLSKLSTTLAKARLVLARKADQKLHLLSRIHKAKHTPLRELQFTKQDLLEVARRTHKILYLFCSYGMFLLLLTGGHIGHTHFNQIPYFFHFTQHLPPKSDTDKAPFNIFKTDPESRHADWQYAGPAFIIVFFTFPPVYFLVTYFRDHYYAPRVSALPK